MGLMNTEGERRFPLEKLTFELNGLAMRVHSKLGHGFSEVVYKDALEIELNEAGIPYEREKGFNIMYGDVLLKHKYYADFIAYDNIVIEVKAQKAIAEENCKQVMNYLAVSKCKIGLIYNFGGLSLFFKRIIL